MTRPTLHEVVLGKPLPEHSKMKLITAAIRKRMPTRGANDGEENPKIIVKFFAPEGSWSWFVIDANMLVQESNGDVRAVPLSYKPKDGETIIDVDFYGLVDGDDKEMGEFSLSELLKVRGPRLGLPIERDRWFDGKRLSDVQ